MKNQATNSKDKCFCMFFIFECLLKLCHLINYDIARVTSFWIGLVRIRLRCFCGYRRQSCAVEVHGKLMVLLSTIDAYGEICWGAVGRRRGVVFRVIL